MFFADNPPPITLSEETILVCHGQHAGGVSRERGEWDGGSFSTGVYIFKYSSEYENFLMRPLGEEDDSRFAYCLEDTDWQLDAINSGERDFLLCSNGINPWRIELKTMRFIFSYLIGYTDGDAPGNTPFVEVGTCTVAQ